MIARSADLDRAEFAAFAQRCELPREQSWSLASTLFAARLDRARSLLDCSVPAGALAQAVADLYPSVVSVAPSDRQAASVERVLCAQGFDRLEPAARAQLVADAAHALAPGGLLAVAAGDRAIELQSLCRRHGLVAIDDPASGAREQLAGRRGVAYCKGPAPARGPKVALAIVSWNQREVLLDTLAAAVREAESLDALDHPALVVVADNGSTDGTPDRLRQLAAALPAAHRLLLSPVNEGISVARNRMIEVALSEGCDYVLLIDGDIEPVPFATYSMIRHLEDCGPSVAAVWPDGESFVTTRERATSSLFGVSGCGVAAAPGRICAGYTVLRRSVLERGARFDESAVFRGPGWGFEDLDFGLQLLDLGFDSHRIERMRFLHRYPGSSIDAMRKLKLDGRPIAISRRGYLLEKWAQNPRIAGQALDVVRQAGALVV